MMIAYEVMKNGWFYHWYNFVITVTLALQCYRISFFRVGGGFNLKNKHCFLFLPVSMLITSLLECACHHVTQCQFLKNIQGSSIQCLRKVFQEINVSYICTRKILITYQKDDPFLVAPSARLIQVKYLTIDILHLLILLNLLKFQLDTLSIHLYLECKIQQIFNEVFQFFSIR